MSGAPKDSSSQSDIIVVAPRLHVSFKCLDRLKERETGGVWGGKRLKVLPLGTPALAAYPDSGGVWTIGWGATGKGIHKGVRWTIQECELRFASDVATREASLRALLGKARDRTTLKQFEAMLSLLFNIGETQFESSTLLRFHLAGHSASAAEQFPRWDHDNGRKVLGLTRRRYEEMRVYGGGEWELGS